MEYELKKLNLSIDDILVIRFEIDQIEGIEEINNVVKAFRDFLPNNQIICIPTYIDFMSIHPENSLNNLEEIKW